MKEQIIAILEKHGLIDENYPNVVKEFEKLCQNYIDLAYCAGIFNTGGIDVLGKELERLNHIGRKPHQIFQRYKPIKTE